MNDYKSAPTRSDTREQAAASPSAAGEGQPVLAYCVLYRDGTEELTWPNKDGTRDENSDEWHGDPKSVIPLSSQAPKPASAGGEPIGYVGLSPNGGAVFAREGDPRPDQYRPWIPVYTAPQPIAAEADTAKVCAECGGIDRYHVTTCSKSLLIETLAADRLAPIEARGVVTVPRKAYETVCAALGHISVGGINDPRDYASRALHQAAELEAEFLRARESAPAVEPVPDGWVLVPREPTEEMLVSGQEAWAKRRPLRPAIEDCEEAQVVYVAMLNVAPSPPSVATGCAGEVTEAMVEAAQREYMRADQASNPRGTFRLNGPAIRAALEAALSQPTRAAGES